VHPIILRYEILGNERLIAGYGVMVSIGMVAGLAMALAIARRRGLDPINVLLVSLIAVTAGLIGSYVLFVATMVREAIDDPSMLLRGGLVFYGGPLAAVPVAWIACRRLDVPPLRMADVAAPSLSLGHALGRMGCFLGGCCFGARWNGPWAVAFTHPLAPAASPSLPRHPVQLYEAGVLIAISLVTLLIWPRIRNHGLVALGYVLCYSIWRFFAETLRADTIRGFVIPGWLSTSQAISLVVIAASLVGLVVIGRRSPCIESSDGIRRP
jgi:phosphatidylglycerol:prolipoprotein diacylglycerol transferase